ncbi:hypothetical protein HY479_00505 [Candidatus Uhrbacteria bacterium]|nr:hypothetical protein [Candidatus Uhrbacteria bacterium]
MALIWLERVIDPSAFWAGWEKLVAETGAGPRAARSFFDWQSGISQSRGFGVGDRSFLALRDGKPIAAAVVPIEQLDGRRQISLVGEYTLAPLVADPGVWKDVMGHLTEAAEAERTECIKLMFDPLDDHPYNLLQRFGFLDASILAYAIDLDPARNLLTAGRHGHEYDIKRILRDPDIEPFVVDRETSDAYERHEIYRALHEKCAGRVTRPKETFDAQFAQLERGEAMMVGLRYRGSPAVCAYFEFQNGKALYASGADDPDVTGKPLYHGMLYTAMQELQRRGVRSIDTGQPASPSAQRDCYPDAKQRNIALFKRGFVGDFRPYYRGVKYCSRAAFESDERLFTERYAETLPDACASPEKTVNS